MKVAVIGTGYVGLVTGACLSALGHRVVCIDSNPERCSAINQGKAPFHEPQLDELIARRSQSGLLHGTTDLSEAFEDSDISIIAVGTPTRNGQADLSFVETAGRQVGRLLAGAKRFHTVVLKSTCVPGTTDTLLKRVLEQESGMKAGAFGLVMNPEFLREGSAVEDFMNPDRIVIGAIDGKSAAAVEMLYSSLDCPKLVTSPRNAEMIKYASNTLLATLISFSNEIARICESLGDADESTVMEGVHLDRRLSPKIDGKLVRPGILAFLKAGIGYGGSCLPKDTAALSHFGRSLGAPTPLVDAVIAINDRRADDVAELLKARVGTLDGKTVAVLGLAFKPDTDDIRESPGLRIAETLRTRGVLVRGWDPVAAEAVRKAGNTNLSVSTVLTEALTGADAAIIATAWPQLKSTDWKTAVAAMRRAVILDGRSILSRDKLPPGTEYLRIGQVASLSR